MAAKFRVSHFRLSTFRRCRRLYKFRYVERLPAPPSASNTMGGHVHSALRDLMALPQGARTAARAADLLRNRWRTNRAGFTGLADEARWRARAIDQVERFARMPQAAGDPVALERYVEVDLTPRVSLIGRIDRIDEGGDGRLNIIDYKTGRPPEEIESEQLRLYAMMIRRQDGRPIGEASFVYLEDGTIWSIRPDEADLESTASGVLSAVDEMTRERAYEPNVGRHCSFCDFRSVCPKRDEIVGRRLAEGW